jgi:hypothetical protein
VIHLTAEALRKRRRVDEQMIRAALAARVVRAAGYAYATPLTIAARCAPVKFVGSAKALRARTDVSPPERPESGQRLDPPETEPPASPARAGTPSQ